MPALNQATAIESTPTVMVGPVLDPMAQRFLDVLARKGGPEINDLSVEDARALLSEAQGRQFGKLPSRTSPSWWAPEATPPSA